MNVPLFSAIFTIAFTVAVGIFMVVVIVMDKVTAVSMIGAVVAGTAVSLPVAVLISKKLATFGKSS